MRTITQTQKITLKVTENDLIEKEWIPYQNVSLLLKKEEESNTMLYKSLRVKLYNSLTGEKYNIKTFAGIKCLSIKNPMKDKVTASHEIAFKLEK